MHKTPFVLNTKPLPEASSAHAGVLVTSRAFRALGYPELIDRHLRIKQRARGFSEAQLVESVVLLQTLGGECVEDTNLFGDDRCIHRGLGYQPPRPTALREFLAAFHDAALEAKRPSRERQVAFILPESDAKEALAQVQAGGVRRIAELYHQRGEGHRIATVDQDATIIESHKRSTLPHYQGGRGYQPMIALWAEADLVLADEFRDGNVPAQHEPLHCCKAAFAALPETVEQRYFRGDSGCYESAMLGWLASAERHREPGGPIGFAISAVMSKELAQAVQRVSEKQWVTIETEADGTKRQWAEVDFVPCERSEHKYSRPLRYVGLRLFKTQGSLFADGSDPQHFAVVTNLEWDGARLLDWHREKAGTIERVPSIQYTVAGSDAPRRSLTVWR